VKFAVIQKGKYLLAASGPASEADSVLVNHVETLYAAYSFYWGPIEQVGLRFASTPRKNLVQCVQMQCRTLVPLLQGFCAKGKSNAFVWLPFSSPPPNTARHFMQASNILSSIQTEREVYGGCMFYDSAVLCTHIDVEITRWMLSLVDLIREDKDRRRLNRDSSLSRAAFVPVYLTAEQCQRLGIEDSPDENVPVSVVRGEADEDEVDEQEDSDPIGVFRTELLVDDLNTYEDTEKGRYVSLCVFFLEKISLALLMNKHADSRSWHVISLKRHLETRLSTLEKAMSSSYSKGFVAPTRTAGLNASISRDNTSDDLRTPFHSLTTDSLTGMTKGSILKLPNEAVGEREDRFLVGSSFVHEVFFDDREINKAMLADHSGLFYGRHMFSKEIYYQRYYSSSDQSLSLEHLEELAQQNMRDQYNINLI